MQCASARRAKRRWSDSSLQVEDPKASGTPTSLAVTFATFSGSATIAVAHFIMHHDMSRRRIDALRLGCCSERAPPVEHAGGTQQDGCVAIAVACGTLFLQRTQPTGLRECRELYAPRTAGFALAALLALYSHIRVKIRKTRTT